MVSNEEEDDDDCEVGVGKGRAGGCEARKKTLASLTRLSSTPHSSGLCSLHTPYQIYIHTNIYIYIITYRYVI